MFAQRSRLLLPQLKLRLFLVEMFIVVIGAIIAASIFVNLGPKMRLGGFEGEYLTRTAYSIATLLPEKGYIPLWQPYMELGDPMLENPVSFAFNPFSIWPSILFGPYTGIQLSIVLSAIIAGLGGWALARVLGLHTLARLLLALLCIGKGNMHAYLSEGHYALFIAQSFFPWIFAGVIAIFQGFRRWPVILIAVSFALVFWSGIPWYPPALVLSIGMLSIICAVRFAKEHNYKLSIEWSKLGLVMLSLVLTISLSAITTIPLLAKTDSIGQSSITEDFHADVGAVFGLYFSNVKDATATGIFPQGESFTYYSYISPLWYAGLMSALLLITILARRTIQFQWRYLLGGIAIIVFCTLWGAGRNPIIEWFYQVIPLANQFRHISRVLAISALWMIVVLALCVDVVWINLVTHPLWARFVSRDWQRKAVHAAFVALLFIPSSFASYDVLRQWHIRWWAAPMEPEAQWEDDCITWLRQQYPDRELSVWTLNYDTIYTYLRNHVRHSWVASDFYHAKPIPSTIYSTRLLPDAYATGQVLPEFAMGFLHFDDVWAAENGYKPMAGAINPYSEGHPCIYQREGAYSYAWWIPKTDLDNNPDGLAVDLTHPITTFIRDYDRIAVLARGDKAQDVVVTVQELAYPGWTVFVNGDQAKLESVGGQIGVVLPRKNAEYTIVFRYLPIRFFIGGIFTLLTIIGCIVYLLRVDRLLSRFVPSLRRNTT